MKHFLKISLIASGLLAAALPLQAVETPAPAQSAAIQAAAPKPTVKIFKGRWEGHLNMETFDGKFESYSTFRLNIKPVSNTKAVVTGTAVWNPFNGSPKKVVKIRGTLTKPKTKTLYPGYQYERWASLNVKFSNGATGRGKFLTQWTPMMPQVRAVEEIPFKRLAFSGKSAFIKY